MTRFKAEPSTFLRHVALAARVSEKTPDPQTEYMQVTVTDDGVTLGAVSMTSTLITPVKYGITVETPGQFIVNAAKFFKMLRGAEHTITITTVDNLSVVIDIGMFRWTLPQIQGIEKLDFGEQISHADVAAFHGPEFISALQAAKKVVSTDPTRWAYQQVAVKAGNMLASDGTQYVKFPVGEGTPDMVLPSNAINDLLVLNQVETVKEFKYKKLDSVHVFYANGTFYTVMDSGYEFPVDDATFRAAVVAATEKNTYLVFGDEVGEGLAAIAKVSPENVNVLNDKDVVVFDAVGEDSTSATIEVKAAGVPNDVRFTVSFERLYKYLGKENRPLKVSFIDGPNAPLFIRMAGGVEYVLFQSVASAA